MKYISDPITQKLSQFVWFFWAILWVSLAIGLGNDTKLSEIHIGDGNEVPGTVASILLWGAIVVQIVKLLYYSIDCNYLLKIGRGLLLIATSIFAYRMTYMLITYGDVYISMSAIIGTIISAIGLVLSSLGVMMHEHFKK